MTRNEYLSALEKELRQLPKKDFQEAMDYFIEYFDEAGIDNEADVIAELGTPQEAASEIVRNVLGKESTSPFLKKARTPKEMGMLILLIIFASPLLMVAGAILIAIGTAALTVVIAMIIALATLLLVGYLMSVAAVILGFVTLAESVTLFSQSWSSLFMGIGGFFVAIGMGVLGFLVSLYLSKLFGKGLMRFGNWMSTLWHNRKWGKRHGI